MNRRTEDGQHLLPPARLPPLATGQWCGLAQDAGSTSAGTEPAGRNGDPGPLELVDRHNSPARVM
jgi:hypothetical protein